jgi:hypothetical protein
MNHTVIIVTLVLIAPPLSKVLDQAIVFYAAASMPLGAFLPNQVLHLLLDLEAAVQGDADLHALDELVAMVAEALYLTVVTAWSDGVHAVLEDASCLGGRKEVLVG